MICILERPFGNHDYYKIKVGPDTFIFLDMSLDYQTHELLYRASRKEQQKPK